MVLRLVRSRACAINWLIFVRRIRPPLLRCGRSFVRVAGWTGGLIRLLLAISRATGYIGSGEGLVFEVVVEDRFRPRWGAMD